MDVLRTALRLGDGALVVGEIRGEEARVLYEAMRVGANANAVLGTIHGDGAEDVYERVVSDLGVEPSSFGATDLVVTVQAYRTSNGRKRRLAAIEEVIVDDDGIRFAPLYEIDDASVATSTNRVDRGNSRFLDRLTGPTESYEDLRAEIRERAAELRTLAADGRTAPSEVAAFLVVSRFSSPYLAPIVAIGLGPGVVCYLYFAPIKAVADHVRAIEEHLVDALYLVGRQVAEGESVEAGLEQAAERVPAETGELFAAAAGVQRRLHVNVDEAFNGEYGALNGIPSPRATGTAALLSIASHEGQPAGRAVVRMADHLEELQEVEQEAKRQLSMVTGTLDHTASYFGPIIAGSTIALAKVIESKTSGGNALQAASTGADVASSGGSQPSGLGGSGVAEASAQATAAFPTDQLAIVVGVYVLLMSVVLTTLSVGLKHGLGRSMVGHRVGRALVSSMLLFVGSFSVANYLIA